ncbi:MAG: ABC transporter ATP-binding protein [Candidatus Pelagadaptatus aseana]|uniref:ABC transporter ATP-binding protein n=1 Tax=Candidatus Pelagadaptatus aseana TaxID=3120508 RepID=UPI0039B1FDDA
MIEVKNLCKSFGDHRAVDDLSFVVRPGEVLGFLGPNGAGKTTTMRMIAGFIEADSGQIQVMGKDVAVEPMATKTMIGYLPEGAPAYGEMSVIKFLEFIADVRGLDGQYRQDRIDAVIARLQLQAVSQQRIETLSKGFKRRVGLAQALLHDPKILILDEPTDGLDPNQKFEVRNLIREIAAEKIVIISTHILEEVDALCQRLIIVSQGQLVADGTPAELKLTSKYHKAVEIEVAEPSSYIELFAACNGVAAVHVSEDNAQTLVLEPEAGAELLAPVQEILAANEIKVQAVSVSGGRLDDVFRRVTAAEQPRNG